jgi:Na+/H+ antiporter NhaD/arsenite permease-like protein
MLKTLQQAAGSTLAPEHALVMLLLLVGLLSIRGAARRYVPWALFIGGRVALTSALLLGILAASLAERSGHSIDFGIFLRYGVITTTVSLLLVSFYVWIRYL